MQRPFRLRQRSDFQRLRAEGQTWKCPALMLSVLPNDLPHNRYGFIVGKRIGKAVQRNRFRRQLREAMRSIHASIKPGYDFVVIARSAEYGYWELRDWLIQLIQRAALWIGEPS